MIIKSHNSLYPFPKVVSVGAAGGLGPYYFPWVKKGMIDAAGFEPEEVAYEKLIQKEKKISWYPYALGDENIKSVLYITENPRCSSCLMPDLKLLSKYPVEKWFRIKSTQNIQLYRFESLIMQNMVKIMPDFLHIDVQGYDYQVLQGFGDLLEKVVCIELETHLKPIYLNQKLFSDVMKFLEDRGFLLRHIDTQGFFEGEVVELNVFFVKDEKHLDKRGKSLIRIWENICRLPSRPVLPDKLV